MLFWIHILRSPPLHYDHGEVWFFPYKYTRYTMNITCTYAKIKKKPRSWFFKPQPPRASLMPSWMDLGFCLFEWYIFYNTVSKISHYNGILFVITNSGIRYNEFQKKKLIGPKRASVVFRRWLCQYYFTVARISSFVCVRYLQYAETTPDTSRVVVRSDMNAHV